jgi:hypothetical protein
LKRLNFWFRGSTENGHFGAPLAGIDSFDSLLQGIDFAELIVRAEANTQKPTNRDWLAFKLSSARPTVIAPQPIGVRSNPQRFQRDFRSWF